MDLECGSWRALHQRRGEAPSLKHAAAGGNKQWDHHHHPTEIRNDPEEGGAGKSNAPKTWQQREETVVGCWLVSAKQQTLKVFCHGKVLVTAGPLIPLGPLWAGECCSGARPSPHALGLMDPSSAAPARRDCPAPPLARTAQSHTHPTHTHTRRPDFDSRGLGCVRLQKNTAAVSQCRVRAAAVVAEIRGQYDVETVYSVFSILYSGQVILGFSASIRHPVHSSLGYGHLNVTLQHPRPSSRHAATTVTAVLSRCHTSTLPRPRPPFRRFVSSVRSGLS